MASDTRVPPPLWINSDFIESALKNTEQKNITVDSINVQYANPEGAGFSSLMFRLTAFLRTGDTGEKEKRTLILKTVLESGEMKDLAESLDVFKTEAGMLHNVMPQVHEQLAALEGGPFRPLTAKCYQWGRQPATYLLMEDLSASGFRLAQGSQPLDLKHCAVVLRAYARLHAASAYLLSKQPHYRDVFSFQVYTDKNSMQHLGRTGKTFMTALANEFDRCPGYEKYAEKYKAFADRFIDVTCESMNQIKKQTKLPILSHGDCWKNNMMFKYVDGEVSEVRLVDFQGSSVTSPASDLSNFLYANAGEEVHRLHMDALLSEYHSTLVDLLRRLGMEREAEVYTIEELKKDMDHCLALSVFFGVMSCFALTAEEHGAESAKALEDPERFNELAAKSFNNPYSLSYIKYITPIFVSKGIL